MTVDTGGKFTTGVVDTSHKFITSVVDSGDISRNEFLPLLWTPAMNSAPVSTTLVINLPPVSMTPAINLPPLSTTPSFNLPVVSTTLGIKRRKQLELASPFKYAKGLKPFIVHIDHPNSRQIKQGKKSNTSIYILIIGVVDTGDKHLNLNIFGNVFKNPEWFQLHYQCRGVCRLIKKP